ncbi:hypothetical protein ANN_27590 [Periplaneta americana]|uniref:PiggyBac transposable element-derived protein domain-containing protein n=1 Tax=Periplaneta americana TaxID=6978 RepID=A0ABQ8RW81_PERAM|nr:hypothetical protein ANN_27590 [Periplaneta americana]
MCADAKERNFSDQHVTAIKEEYEDQSLDLTTEIKFEKDAEPISLPVVKREPELEENYCLLDEVSDNDLNDAGTIVSDHDTQIEEEIPDEDPRQILQSSTENSSELDYQPELFAVPDGKSYKLTVASREAGLVAAGEVDSSAFLQREPAITTGPAQEPDSSTLTERELEVCAMGDREPEIFQTYTGNGEIVYGKNRYKLFTAPLHSLRTRQHNIARLKLPQLRGAARAIHSNEPIEFWKLLFDDKILNWIVTNTNAKIRELSANYLWFDDPAQRELRKENGNRTAAISEIFDRFIADWKANYTQSEFLTVRYWLDFVDSVCSWQMEFSKSKKVEYSNTKWTLISHQYAHSNRNITGDNWFSSVELVDELLKVGIVRKNKREIPEYIIPTKKDAEGTKKIVFTKDKTLVSYVPKKGKFVCLISSMHHDSSIAENGKPEIIEDYNRTKGESVSWKARGTKTSRSPRRRWEDNIKMDLWEVGYDDRDWINLGQDMDRWRAYVRAAMNLRIPYKQFERNFSDHHMTAIKEEYEDQSLDLTTEIKFEENAEPISLPVMKREPEERNFLDHHVTGIKEEYVNQSPDLLSEVKFEEDPFAVVKREPERSNVELLSRFVFRENTEILFEPSKGIGLGVNPEKTKYLNMSRDQNILRSGNIKIGDLCFEEVEKFKYRVGTVTNINDTQEEIKRRINMGNAWAGHVARMRDFRNAYRMLVGRPEGKRPLDRPKRRWEDNIKMDLREVGYDNRDWIDLAQDRDQWQAYVRTAMNLRVP